MTTIWFDDDHDASSDDELTEEIAKVASESDWTPDDGEMSSAELWPRADIAKRIVCEEVVGFPENITKSFFEDALEYGAPSAFRPGDADALYAAALIAPLDDEPEEIEKAEAVHPALQRINQRAAEIADANPEMSKVEAYTRALQDRALDYEKYVTEVSNGERRRHEG